jgi:hypothetical protein
MRDLLNIGIAILSAVFRGKQNGSALKKFSLKGF